MKTMTCTIEIEVEDDFAIGDCDDCPFQRTEYKDYDDDGYIDTDIIQYCSIGYNYKNCPLEKTIDNITK